MDKPAIKKFAVWARKKLIADTKYRAGLVGVTETTVAEPLPQSNESVQFFDVGLPQPYRIESDAVTQRQRFVAELNKETAKQGSYTAAYQTVVDKVAYTWFNRLIAVRYMEVNDLLPSRTRVLSSADGRAEPQIVTSPFDAVLDYTPAEQQQIVTLKNDNKLDEAFRLLFLKQCAALGDCLPRLFEQVDDYMPLLLALSFTDKDGVVCHLVNDIPESDWLEEDNKGGAVQIVGWLYQYYNTEPKEQVFANLKKNIKISAENIPAATQLFTPDWIVRYMVENSLGRLWSEGHPDFDKSEWKYYLDEAPQEPQVAQQLAELRKGYAALTPEDIKCIDPCMGSGHILAYLFDVLMQIYRSAGYTDRDAAASIVEHNLYGLDIDDRAAQMAYFVVMMKGCHYDSRFLRRHLNPHVYAIQESNGINRNQLKSFGNGLSDFERNEARLQLEGLLDTLTNAKEYGSILNMENYNWALLRSCADAAGEDAQLSMDSFGLADTVAQLKQLIDIGEALGQKYDVVVTNPPYMAPTERQKPYLLENFIDSKNDMAMAFIEKCISSCKPNGYSALIVFPTWMFLSSYEKLRTKIIKQNTISCMVYPGRGIFGSDFGSTSFVINRNRIYGYKGSYSKLFKTIGEVAPQEVREQQFLSGMGRYVISQQNFLKIPGNPMAFWISNNFLKTFDEKKIADISVAKAGIVSGNDPYFLRLWHEVDCEKITKDAVNFEDHTAYRWVPLNKGGSYRRYYGNYEYIINIYDLWNRPDKVNISVRRSEPEYYFKKALTWSSATMGASSFRITENKTSSTAAPNLFFNSDNDLYVALALLNSSIAQFYMDLLNPTVSLNSTNVSSVPAIGFQEATPSVVPLCKENISISKSDWDSFETSWDFAEHPLVKWSHDLWDATSIGATMAYYYHGERPEVSCPVELCYLLWQGECNDRFAKLKANEEELNRIFIDIYGLQDELTPEVEDKDVTVRRADLGRDIRSLISYAVGCIFGRYSLDKPGLAYAGGDWNPDQYHTFLPDADNVIPITDEEYFPDDLAGLFVAWVKKVFGANSLEDNLAFIAKALGTKGTSPRAVIRNYFLNGFYADHVKIYQKRPIYWLYDSGKQNGFKALIYMHRYNADTSGLVRADYLYKMEQVYESEIARMDDAIAHGASREVAQATKRKEKLVKQLKECKDYDDRLGHIALARIPIDLDDGVKVNYDKVQTGADGKKLAILAKI